MLLAAAQRRPGRQPRLQAWRAEVARGDAAVGADRRRSSRRGGRTTSRSAMRQPISWSALADAAVGVWGLGVEGGASVRRLAGHGRRCPCWSTTRRRRPSRRASGAGHGAGRVGRPAALRRRRQEPGDQPVPARGGAARGGRASRSAVASGCSWRRPIRRAWPASPGRRARAPRRRSPSTCSPAWATRPGPAATSGARPGTPTEAGDPDYWIVETSSFQVPDLAVGPHVVAVTSLSPDHLDWHGTVERYYADKLSCARSPA